MKVGERGDSDRHRSVRKPEAKPKPSSASTSSKTRESTASKTRRPDTTRDRSTATSRAAASTLDDRETSETESNPGAGREVTRRQSRAAAALTGNHDGPSFDSLANEDDDSPTVRTVASTDSPGVQRLLDDDEQATLTPEEQERQEKLDHLVTNPVEEEQRSDLQTPAPFQAGSAQPEIPNFQDQQPTRSEPSPTGGTVDTFERDGVTYTRTTGRDGTVSTTYEQDGVNYSNTAYQDGRSSTLISDDTETGLHSRTIETAANGQVTDTSRSSQGTFDGAGNWSYQSREESVGPDGVRTINEEVNRPDGGTATVTRTVQPDGRVNEVYNYAGDQGTVNRTTNTAVDGTSETRTERSYTVDQPLESVLSENGVAAPSIPESIEHQVPELPEGQREDTQVRQVEVVTADAAGNETVQYSEESYSQTSGDVQPAGSRELGHSSVTDAFPQPILPNSEDSSATRTVTRVRTRDENGQLVESTGASQSVTLVGDRSVELGDSGQVSVTRTDTWNASGESSSNFASQGFREEDLLGFNGRSDQFTGFQARVGDDPFYNAGYPEAGVGPFDAYNRKGGDELQNWFDLGGGDELDISVTVNRNAEGDVTDRSLTLDATDSSGNGRTATRTDNGGAVGWTYNDYSNGGQDYRRQTVFEGTDISIYEEHEVTGPGQFRTTSETREGDDVVANSSASRQEVTQAQLQQSVADGELTQAQLDRMLQDGPPYYAERFSEHATALRDDDGNLREDENGNPIQPGHDITSTTLANSQGYSVSEHWRRDPGGDDGAIHTESRLNTVTDPNADPPLAGQLHTQRMDPSTCRLETVEQGSIEVGANGQLRYDGQEIGQFEFGGSDLSALLRDGKSVTANDLVTLLGGAAEAGEGFARAGNAGLTLTANSAHLGRLAHGAKIFGVAAGAQGLFHGIREGDGRAIVEGLGNIAGGLNSLAAATSALGGATRFGSAASRFSTLTAGTATLGKVLGAAGGVVSLGFGLYDVFTADSGWDKAAGGLAAAAGAVAIGSAFFGPPGWVVGGLVSGALGIASIFVGGGDDNETASIDDRLR